MQDLFENALTLVDQCSLHSVQMVFDPCLQVGPELFVRPNLWSKQSFVEHVYSCSVLSAILFISRCMNSQVEDGLHFLDERICLVVRRDVVNEVPTVNSLVVRNPVIFMRNDLRKFNAEGLAGMLQCNFDLFLVSPYVLEELRKRAKLLRVKRCLEAVPHSIKLI